MSAAVLAVDSVDTDTLYQGLFVGSLAMLVSALLALVLHKSRPGVIGIPLAAAVAITLRDRLDVGFPISIIAAALLTAVAGEFVTLSKRRTKWLYVAYLPGFAAIAFVPVDAVSIGTRISIGMAAIVSAILFGEFDRRHERDGLFIALFAVASAGPMFIARGSLVGPAVLASTVPFCVLLFPRPQARFGNAGVGAVAVAYWWTVALIVNGNGSVIAASWVALGFVLWEPLARMYLPKALRPSRHNDHDSRWLVLGTAAVAQGAAVAYASFVVAKRTGVDIAMLAVLPAMAVGLFGATAVAPTPRRRKSRREESDPDAD